MPHSADRAEPPATYWVLEAELSPEAEELWSWHCFERGATGSEWLEERPARLRIAYFFDQLEPRDTAAWLAGFRAAFPAAPAPTRLTATERHREAWDTAWHAHFAPVVAGAHFWVCPPWDVRPEGDGRLPLIIEPGQGFGTGRHASTVLAIELIEALLESETAESGPPGCIVDVGCGSGILALAARMLGVPRAIAIDIEHAAVQETALNFEMNHLAPPLRVQGGPASLRGRYPLVVANLVMPLLERVADDLAALTAPGGSLIVSGVLESERELLLPPYTRRGFTLRESRAREGWIACRFEAAAR